MPSLLTKLFHPNSKKTFPANVARQKTLLRRCPHTQIITRLPQGTPYNDLTTSSTPHPQHLTTFDSPDYDVSLITNPNLCLRCSITDTFGRHLSLVSHYAIAVDAVEREYKYAADNVALLGTGVDVSGEECTQDKHHRRDRIINNGLKRVLDLENERNIEVENIWQAFRFDWDRATHRYLPATANAAEASSEDKYSDWQEREMDQQAKELVNVTRENAAAELKQLLMRVNFERSHNGELVRVVMVWYEWVPKDIVKDNRRGIFVEKWSEDIRLTLN